MEEFVVSYSLENEQQFWDGVSLFASDIISVSNISCFRTGRDLLSALHYLRID